MAVPILWAPGVFAFFLQENLHAHKIPRFREGEGFFWALRGGGGPFFIFYGRGDFSDGKDQEKSEHQETEDEGTGQKVSQRGVDLTWPHPAMRERLGQTRRAIAARR